MPTVSTQRVVTASQLGQYLLVQRKGRKLTQAEVGYRVGLSQNRISYLEKHPDELSFKQLLSWCSAVGLEVSISLPEIDPKTGSEW